jgi:hypothetical protein
VGLIMSFLAPAAFWFAVALPLIVLFYLLKRKRTVRLVPSTLLWQKFLAETQASAPFQRLRKNWMLFLQLLLAALLVLALARPYWAGSAVSAELRVVILDGSASMKATDVSPSRFEAARVQALKWVDGLTGDDQMVVLLAGAQTQVKQSATTDKAALRRALQACQPADTPTHLQAALRMADSLVRDRPDAEVHLFSDGAVSGLDEFENKGLPLVYHRIGASGENLAITAMDVRANPDLPAERALYVSVHSYASNPQPASLEILFGEQLIETRAFTAGPGATPQVFQVRQTQDGVFTARLTSRDALMPDNSAAFVSTLPRPAKVYLLSNGNRFLEKALRALPSAELVVSANPVLPAAELDIVVLDNLLPATWPASANVLAFRSVPTNWIPRVTRVENPPLVDWRTSHPLLRHCGFDNVYVAESLTAPVPDSTLSILDTTAASLMLAGEMGNQRLVWIGFDLLESNWPLRVSFPIFIANAIEWLNPAQITHRLNVKTGDPFRYRLEQPAVSARVTLPDQSTRTVEIAPNAGELVFPETFQQGVYTAEIGTNRVRFSANLLNTSESAIQPRDDLQMGKYNRVAATTRQSANTETWRWVASLALVFLLFEWWFYHRRTV